MDGQETTADSECNLQINILFTDYGKACDKKFYQNCDTSQKREQTIFRLPDKMHCASYIMTLK
jgi:hypothetical protein